MNIIDAIQGSQQWLDIRAKHFTASEAPAMLGASKYQTRSELLRQKHTGLAADVDSNTQRLFDRGHAAEAAARPIAEAIMGAELFPATGALEVDGMPLLASFDGITMLEDACWENKLWNATLADAVRAGQLEPHYYWQLEQQLLVSGAERAFFTTSDGTPENTVGMWYASYPERRTALIAGWKQFAEDLANYQHDPVGPAAPVAAPIEALPALLVQVEGRVLATNLDAFKAAAQTFIDGIKTELVNDQDFADADKMVKFLKDGEDRLAQAKQHALAQTASIDELFRTVDAISEQMRSKRLALDKLVKAEKENRRVAIINEANAAYWSHIDRLNERLGGDFMPRIVPAFAESIKGLKSIDSMRDKVSTTLANGKIEANECADRIEVNKRTLDAQDDVYAGLFPDLRTIISKPDADFLDTMNARIASYKAVKAEKEEAAKKAEEARIAAAIEAERVRAAAAIESERMAEAKRAAEAAQQAARAQPEAAITPPTPEEKRAAVVEAQDDIADFINSREWGREGTGKIRAILVEYEAFKAGRGLKVAA